MPYNSSESKGADFWERVAVELKRKGWRQADLVRNSLVDQGAISSGQRRKSMPLADNALKIAEALGVKIQYLINGIQDENQDIDLEEAFKAIRKSRRNSGIAKVLPHLNEAQLSALETMIQSWGYANNKQVEQEFKPGASGEGASKALA